MYKGMGYLGQELSLCPGGRNGEGDQAGDKASLSDFFELCSMGCLRRMGQEQVAPLWHRWRLDRLVYIYKVHLQEDSSYKG